MPPSPASLHRPGAGGDDTPAEVLAGGGVDDTVRGLADAMARFRTLAAEAADRMATALDLPTGQFAALLAVDEGAVNVSAVAHQCLTHLSNASRTVDALVQAGLVDRAADPDDRRAVLLSVTATGRERLDCLHDNRDRFMARALGDIGAADRVRLVDLLARLVGNLEDLVACDDPFAAPPREAGEPGADAGPAPTPRPGGAEAA